MPLGYCIYNKGIQLRQTKVIQIDRHPYPFIEWFLTFIMFPKIFELHNALIKVCALYLRYADRCGIHACSHNECLMTIRTMMNNFRMVLLGESSEFWEWAGRPGTGWTGIINWYGGCAVGI